MNSRELLIRKMEGKEVERLLFCPAIYEHKAKLINSSPSEIATNSDKLFEAIIAEYETYHPDVLTVGVDIYNVEAESLGAKVAFSDVMDEVPSLSNRIITDINSVKLPPLEKIIDNGRMHFFADTAKRVVKAIGKNIFIRGGLTGPYSIAAAMIGIEPLIMAIFTDKDQVEFLLDYCADIAIEYGKLYIEAGCGICMFDSQAVPPLVSPDMYCDMILPRVKHVFESYRKAGVEMIEYVTGGDTTAISESLVQTSADIILSDFSADINTMLKTAKEKQVLIRRNISPVCIENGIGSSLDQIHNTRNIALQNQNVIVGTGVLSCNVKTEDILAVRDMVLN